MKKIPFTFAHIKVIRGLDESPSQKAINRNIPHDDHILYKPRGILIKEVLTLR